MRYVSTRGNDKGVTAKEAIIRGLAQDGGLYVPEAIPNLDRPLEALLKLPYTALAQAILRPFLDFSETELATCVEKAYSSGRFTHPKIAPVVTPLKNTDNSGTMNENIHFLELFHGPTLAFKDMALSILPHLMKASASKQELIILTATSGDTGKAALEAFCDVEGVSIVVFYPESGVSNMQKRQMVTQEGNNTYVFGVKGNFDDAQTGVKKIFSDPALAKDMAQVGKMFSSANSINIGRLLPQIVYYFYAYGQLAQKGSLKVGDEINFVVPTGNFGNILAGYYAKEMGLPIRKLICASNDNKVLYDFFRTGEYDKNRAFHCTISPSMDILVSSNLERLLFHATDTKSVQEMMGDLASQGRFETQVNMPDFYGIHTSEEETCQAIFECAKKGYVMDPHTAVAYHAGQRYIEETGDITPQIVISTASPYKFSEDVLKALNVDWEYAGNDKDMAAVQALSETSDLVVPEAVVQLANQPVRHTIVCPVEDMTRVLVSKII